ncbi:hypothetical protein QJS10_CPB15g01219 [Acorus calamus]|uniref:Uncharacterized protein n=1 Tax=Acorus calamus TaxID=4465 RepID=A0AAV9D6L6_ACOCL|nr:hypothetical protein QJS10_CPB15g01219 [Acorus calamus]
MDLSKLTLEIFSCLEQQWLLNCDVPSPCPRRLVSSPSVAAFVPPHRWRSPIRLEMP